MLPAIPVVYGAIAGLATFLGIKMFVTPGIAKGAVVAPDFAASPAAQKATPPGVSTQGLPVITQDQFNTLDQAGKDDIAALAQINKIATLSGSQGTLFASQAIDPLTAAGGVFDTQSINSDNDGTAFAGRGWEELKITVDVGLARQRGLDLPIAKGNVLFQCTGRAGETTVPAVSLDPRLPGRTANIPLFAITGAGTI